MDRLDFFKSVQAVASNDEIEPFAPVKRVSKPSGDEQPWFMLVLGQLVARPRPKKPAIVKGHYTRSHLASYNSNLEYQQPCTQRNAEYQECVWIESWKKYTVIPRYKCGTEPNAL